MNAKGIVFFLIVMGAAAWFVLHKATPPPAPQTAIEKTQQWGQGGTNVMEGQQKFIQKTKGLEDEIQKKAQANVDAIDQSVNGGGAPVPPQEQ